MILKNRVIWSDNGTLKDVSSVLNNHISGSAVLPINSLEDHIFLGSEAPFNHRWIEMKAMNAAASEIQIHLWDGTTWQAVAQVIDETEDSTGTKTLTKSGLLAWVPDKANPAWAQDDTYDTASNMITGLSTVKIYDLYWARLTFTGNLTVTTEISFIGHKFAHDEDLTSIYPELASTEYKERFKSGLTTWDQVHFEAAKCLIRDMKASKVIDSGNQILEWEVLRLPAIHKAAELIFTAFGSDWEKERTVAAGRYMEAMKVEQFTIDENKNAMIDTAEVSIRTGRLIR